MAEEYSYSKRNLDVTPGGDTIKQGIVDYNEARLLEILTHINTHKNRTESHGVFEIVGASEAQTLTNKVLADPVVSYAGEPAQNAPVTRGWIEGQSGLAVTQAGAARDAAVVAKEAAEGAQAVAETARDEAVTAKVDTLATKSAAATEISTAESSALSAIESAKDWATDYINGMASYSPDLQTILTRAVQKLHSGELQGVDGPMEFDFVGMLPFTRAYNSTRTIGATRVWVLSNGEDVSAWPNSPLDREAIDVDKKMMAMAGGVYYEIAAIAKSILTKEVFIELSPLLGISIPDPSGDILFLQFKASTDPAKQQEGQVDCREIFPGSKYTLTDLWTETIVLSDGLPGWFQPNSGTVSINGRTVTNSLASGSPAILRHTDNISGELIMNITNNSAATLRIYGMSPSVEQTIATGVTSELTWDVDGATDKVGYFVNADSSDLDFTVNGMELKQGQPYTIAELYALFSDQMTNIAPDPTFEQDGTAGGWNLLGDVFPTISDGKLHMGAGQWSAAFVPITGVEGKKYLCKFVVDSGSVGRLFTTAWPNATDGTTDENYAYFITAPGVYYSIIEADTESTGIFLQTDSVGGTDAVISEFSIYEIPDTLTGTINPGYIKDAGWQSQMLGDLPTIGNNARQLKPSRKVANGLTAALRYRKYNGDWIDGVRNSSEWDTTPLNWVSDYNADAPPSNKITFNVGNTFPTLGFSSLGGMLSLSAINLDYKTMARRLHPIDNPSNVLVPPQEVFYLAHNDANYGGSAVVTELIGNVPTGTGSTHLRQQAVNNQYVFPDTRRVMEWTNSGIKHDIWPIGYDSGVNAAVKVAYSLYLANGVLNLAAYFQQLRYNPATGDWGDTGEIPISISGVKTMLLANGLIGLYGIMGCPLPIEYVEGGLI